MPVYNYVGIRNGNKVKGTVEASDINAARVAIRKMGLLLIEVKEGKNFFGGASKAANASIPKLPLKDKIEFTTTLQILTTTGTPIIEALAFLEENADRKNILNICRVLKNQIVNGSTLAETMEKNRASFGRVYAGLVRAGEDSGELDVTLARMLELLKKQASIKSKVIGALIYPTFVIVLAALVVTVMLAFVFPAFESMFDSLGGELPLVTRLCIDAGIFIQEYWWVMILLFGLVIALVVFLFTNPVTKKAIDRFTLRVPLLSDLMRFANYSNFLAVLQVAYDAGIPVVNCMYLANLTLENIILREAISTAAIKVQQGSNLSAALKETHQMPNILIFMIATGEQSGRLGEMLYNSTAFVDKKLDDVIDSFTKLVEPFMLIVVGALVLFLALSLYMPLFGAYAQM